MSDRSDVMPGMARGVRIIALFEAIKGVLVLLAGLGLASLSHEDPQMLAERLVALLHLNPARHYPQVFIAAVSHANDSRILLLAGLMFAYAALRFAEAYGLWRMRAWAEWLGIVSGALYLPFEAYELVHEPGLMTAAVLLMNVLVVAWLLRVRHHQHQHSRHE